MNSVNGSTARPVRVAPRLQSRFFISLVVSAGLIFSLALPFLDSSPSSHTFKVAQAASDPVIAAAGDIACDPASSNFNGGNGTASLCRQKYTSDLMVNKGYAAVLALGDNQYYCGGYQAFLQSYDLSWGRVKSITHPAVGNHEYLTSGGTDCTVNNGGAAGYFNYFGAAAGTLGQGYYSFDIGDWHIIALNSNCGDAGGCSSGSPQYAWLQADLAAHQNLCTLAYWHIPLFSSGGRAAANSKAFWQLLYNNNADLILNGHDHIYERFAPQDPTGAFDPIQGIRELIVGTGGSDHTSIAQIVPNSERRNVTTYGVLELTLHSNSADWRFIPEAGKTFTDSGTTVCHGVSSDTTPPTAPANLYATTVSSTQVNLVWAASTDNVGVTGYRVLRNGVQIGVTSGTSYSDATVQANITYDYSVIASDAGLNTSPSPNILSVTTPPILTFNPIADTYVQSDIPTTNFGSAGQMVVDNSPVSHMLMKFAVSGVGGKSVLSAKLRLYCLDGSPFGGEFHRVTDNSWDELIVDWNTAPSAQTSVLKTLGAVAPGSWYEVDVTSLITGDGTFSLMAVSSSSDEAYYSTKEGTAGFAPQLIVSTSINNPTVTPAPNATSTPRNTRTPTITRTPSLTPSPTPTFTPRVAGLQVFIGGVPQPVIPLAAGASKQASYPINAGPVKVQSLNGSPIIVTERDAWLVNGVAQSFSEMMGLPDKQLTNTYYFPWYNNVTMDTQLRFANLGSASTNITVTIAGKAQPVIPLAAGASTRISYPINAGPVKVQSSGNVPIIAAERHAWLINGVVKSFSEMMGLPANLLTTTYYFPLYNNLSMDTQLRIANLGSTSTNITVTIAGKAQPVIPLAAGASKQVNYPINAGPVKIQSSGNVPIIVTERDAWLVNGVAQSFSEMMGLPDNQLTNIYYFPLYNNVTMDTQLRFANLGSASTNITVTIAGKAQPVIPLAAGASIRISYPINAGPVKVQSSGNVPIIAAERHAWLINGVVKSFSEMMGLPANLLTTTYYFPLYNNLSMDTQLRFAAP